MATVAETYLENLERRIPALEAHETAWDTARMNHTQSPVLPDEFCFADDRDESNALQRPVAMLRATLDPTWGDLEEALDAADYVSHVGDSSLRKIRAVCAVCRLVEAEARRRTDHRG